MNAEPVLPPLRRDPRDARLHRPQRPYERRPQSGRDLPRADDDGRLPAARMITTPFGLYDCDVPCDASIAVVVSAARPPVTCRIRPSGSRRWAPRSSSASPGSRAPSRTSRRCSANRRTCGAQRLRPSDVDLALLYDGFTFNAISWLEALGFCGLGEAQDWLDKGRRIALDGELPVNPHGGQLSEGRTHGFGFIYEAVTQLRHDAGRAPGRRCQDGRGHLRRRHAVGSAAPAT